MELNKIEQLLNKYLEGETSLTEEQTLQEFFNSSQVPSHLLSYQPLFNYFSNAKTEVYTKTLPLKTETPSVYKWFSVAAVILISAGVFFNWSVSNADLGTYKKNETKIENDYIYKCRITGFSMWSQCKWCLKTLIRAHLKSIIYKPLILLRIKLIILMSYKIQLDELL